MTVSNVRTPAESRGDATAMDSELDVRVSWTGESPVVACAGHITVFSTPHLLTVLLEVLRERTAPTPVVIDFSRVSYLESAGVATLVEALIAARQHSTQLRLVGVHGQARRIAQTVKLGLIFRSFGSEVEFV